MKVDRKFLNHISNDHWNSFFMKDDPMGVVSEASLMAINVSLSPKCKCGDLDCGKKMVASLESTILYHWITKHTDELEILIETHKKGHLDYADRAVDELLGHIRARKDGPGAE